jgi:hypothetical protein
MNTFVLLLLQESMVQRGSGKDDQQQESMTVLVINHGIIKSISILTANIRPMLKFSVDKPLDCFLHKVKRTLAIC